MILSISKPDSELPEYQVLQSDTAQNAIINNQFWGISPIVSNYPPEIMTGEPTTSLFEIFLNDEEIIKLERETYEKKKDEYLDKYEGKYIAFLYGEMRDYDKDLPTLAKRVYEKYGYRAIYMPLVTKDEVKYKMISPKYRS
jgi:hypothetical protein